MDDPFATDQPLVGAALHPDVAADVETVARGGATQIAGQATHRSLSFFFNAIAFRVLGPTRFGLYGVVTQTLAIAAEIGGLGLQSAVLRFVTIARVRANHGGVLGTIRVALIGVAATSVIVVAVLVVGNDVLARAFADSPTERDTLAFLYRLGALYVPLFAFMQILRYATQAYKTMVPSVTIGNLIQPTAQFAIGTAALALGFAVSGAVFGLVAGTAIAVAAGIVYLRRILTDEEKHATRNADPRAILRFALPQAGSQLLGLQGLGLGIILLGARSSTSEVGLFAAALALQGPAGVFQAGALNIWAPMVSDLHDRGEIERLRLLYVTVTRWIATFALPISAAMLIEPELFALFFGGEQARDAAPVIAILALANIFHTLGGASIYVLTMTGHPGINFGNALVAVVAYASVGWFVAADHGAVGIAWVDAAIAALLATARVTEARALVGVHPFARSLLAPIGAAILGASFLIGWRIVLPDDIWIDVIGTALALGLYLAMLAKLGIPSEERHVWDVIRRQMFGSN